MAQTKANEWEGPTFDLRQCRQLGILLASTHMVSDQFQATDDKIRALPVDDLQTVKNHRAQIESSERVGNAPPSVVVEPNPSSREVIRCPNALQSLSDGERFF